VGLIVDASVAVKWVILEEGSSAAAMLQDQDMHAPGMLWPEVGNALRSLAARRAISADLVARSLDVLIDVPVVIHPLDGQMVRRALQMALDLNHPIYDCLYLALAQRLALPLVTADRRLIAAVARGGLPGVTVRALMPDV
jgi:predicted nucleic acid-binding protein